MPLTLRVIPGYQFFEGERLDTNKLNHLGRPTIELLGSISSAIIAPGSITSDKLSPSLISQLPHKPDPLDPNDLLMIEDVSVTALKNITISQVLSAGIKGLPLVTTVKFDDTAFVIHKGINQQATVGDFLQEAISGQTPLARAGDIDPVADMVWLWDATATAGTNPNRKALIGDFVASFTNTLIAHSLPFTGTLDPVKDQILLNDASLTAPDQQVRVSLGTLLAQAGGAKAWANINAKAVIDSLTVATWDFDADVISTATPQNVNTGDWIWFRPSDSGNGVLPVTPYYVRMLDNQSTAFRLFNTKAAALANDTAQLVDLTQLSTPGRIFLHWHDSPIRAGSNIASIITTRFGSDPPGYFRISFETPMPTANYGVQLTGSYYKSGGSSAQVIAINVGGADADPSYTTSPSVNSFDIVCFNTDTDHHVPDFLMISIFS